MPAKVISRITGAQAAAIQVAINEHGQLHCRAKHGGAWRIGALIGLYRAKGQAVPLYVVRLNDINEYIGTYMIEIPVQPIDEAIPEEEQIIIYRPKEQTDERD